MLGLHIDCEAGGKWVKDGVCSACGEQVHLYRRPPAESRSAETILMEVRRSLEELGRSGELASRDDRGLHAA